VIICGIKAAQFIMEGEQLSSVVSMASIGLPYALHILAASTRLAALLPRALRGVDAVPAHRLYMALACLATVATGINPLPNATEHLKYAGDLGLLLAVAWFERPRAPATGVALSLLVGGSVYACGCAQTCSLCVLE
jgi:hypothetical protein